jgi:hypothetical protein
MGAGCAVLFGSVVWVRAATLVIWCGCCLLCKDTELESNRGNSMDCLCCRSCFCRSLLCGRMQPCQQTARRAWTTRTWVSDCTACNVTHCVACRQNAFQRASCSTPHVHGQSRCFIQHTQIARRKWSPQGFGHVTGLAECVFCTEGRQHAAYAPAWAALTYTLVHV